MKDYSKSYSLILLNLILFSFYDKGSVENYNIIRECSQNILVDSGAFSMVNSNPNVKFDKYLKDYVKFIRKVTDNAKGFDVRKNVVETLFDEGFDVSVRLAPFLYDTADFDMINSINVDKCLVEFLRINNNAKKGLRGIIDFKDYTVSEGGCRHLPLNKKLDVLGRLDFKELSVCDDVQEHYDYFLKNVCFNSEDCCNLSL